MAATNHVRLDPGSSLRPGNVNLFMKPYSCGDQSRHDDLGFSRKILDRTEPFSKYCIVHEIPVLQGSAKFPVLVAGDS